MRSSTFLIYICILVLLIPAGCRHKDDPDEGIIPDEEVKPDQEPEEKPDEEKEFVFELNPERISCGASGGRHSIYVTCSEEWSFQDTLSWIQMEKTGADSALATIFPNAADKREGKVTFSSKGHHIEVLVEQASSDDFKIDRTEIASGYDGEKYTVKVTSYYPWKGECGQEWISLSPESGADPAEVQVTVLPNTERTERTGSVVFSRDDKESLTVNIIQKACPFVELARKDIETDGDGGIFDILYLTNTAVECECNEDWIRIIRHTDVHKLSFEVERNFSEAREGKITLRSATDGRFHDSVIVRQGEHIPHPALSFREGSSLTVTERGELILTPVFEEMDDKALIWSSSSPDIAKVDNTGIITVKKTGKCTIRIVNPHHSVEASILLDIKLKAEGARVMFGNQDISDYSTSARFIGEMIPVTIQLEPEDAYREDFIYLSSDTEVADFNDNVLHCYRNGKTQIYIESKYNELHFNFTVLVVEE